ncbi:threonine dehydrogenase-like Zn-dependent dehydrogenase [Actinoplanes lutulentus]|uniref:Threonine dehydrogenase-like Zn-dependent dehydrogenase n=1 Tax=Actinoplanes lutulentus TaxID=1287878 RepID=A0A327Z5B6_9ACTN|nr:alcohol dehydrogenase catalytic domain-containing protein [Actinoplanes lutulentus]MBB2940463.1 threonine dehydrogenase-like Zn-dependent dehydrogenase [Actinoplanes lutulentus]RAK25805.1 threonine dehydrogenase-like Zn-dependent dehydrogenase [Actinoplanes lutulentus]
MRAVIVHETALSVVERPVPEPGRGQVLLKVLRAGICGSDLHIRLDADSSADIAAEVGYDHFMRQEQSVVLGHEFVGEIVSYGPGCRARWGTGTHVVALPLLRVDGQVHMVGLSEHAPGGYAEYLLADEDALLRVPKGLDPDLAALTEPLAVAHHAVRMGEVRRGDPAVVIGCGPIGLAVILMLKAAGVRHVVASDFSAARRELAVLCGADVVVDPAVGSPWDLGHAGMITSASAYYGAGLEALHALRSVPGVPWRRVMRGATRLGAGPRGPVVFECVGLPGVIESIVSNAPFLSTIVVVGVCMSPDTFRPTMASNKELQLRFSFCYDPADFDETLRMIARGTVDARRLITRVVGLSEVEAAFEELGAAKAAKILIDPSLHRRGAQA